MHRVETLTRRRMQTKKRLRLRKARTTIEECSLQAVVSIHSSLTVALALSDALRLSRARPLAKRNPHTRLEKDTGVSCRHSTIAPPASACLSVMPSRILHRVRVLLLHISDIEAMERRPGTVSLPSQQPLHGSCICNWPSTASTAPHLALALALALSAQRIQPLSIVAHCLT